MQGHMLPSPSQELSKTVDEELVTLSFLNPSYLESQHHVLYTAKFH